MRVLLQSRALANSILLIALAGCSSSGSDDSLAAGVATPARGNGSQVVDILVDWDTTIRQVPAYSYGVNSSANFIPSYSNDPGFMRSLELITQKRGFVRLHGWGMLGDSPEAWQENGIWDADKIERALQPLVDEGYTVMINIPAGPQGEDDYLDPIAFARFCADLVQIVNVDLGLGIQYWEIPNERESGFTDPGLSVNEMATLMRAATQRMKAVDPTIKVGGPATAWVNIEYVSQLVAELYPVIDFLTVHSYSGDGSNSLEDAYNVAQYATTDLAEIRARVNSITGDSYLPIFLTEYNIDFLGTPRMETNKGAVYDAIILTQTIESGADASFYWNIAPYSGMSFLDGQEHNENMHIYQIFNQSFHGDLQRSQSSDASSVVVYAVSDQDSEGYAFGLINRSPEPQQVKLNFNSWLPAELTWHLWDDDNDFSTLSIDWTSLKQGEFILSPYSVNLFVD